MNQTRETVKILQLKNIMDAIDARLDHFYDYYEQKER